MTTTQVDRTLSIYGALTDRPEPRGAREGLSAHLTRIGLEGEKDQHRLMMEGLSYLDAFHRKIDSQD